MAALIVEITHRHNSQFYRIDKPVTRVGRALDNDIILSDPAVSPYHFVVRRNQDGEYELHSLADENGIRIGRQTVVDPVRLTELPLEFDAGRTRIRILHPSQPVAPTRLISCRNGSACLFGHWSWALFLFGCLIVISGFDNYLSTPQVLSWTSYGRDQMIIIAASLGLSIGLLVINRITSHRWDVAASLSFVSLFLIAALLIEQVVLFVDYFFTSSTPGIIVSLAWSVLLLPMAMGWFLVRLNHGNATASILFIIALNGPAGYLQIKEAIMHYDLLNDFSKKAYYSDTLYPWDKRLDRTISIDEFAQNSMQHLLPTPDSD